MNSLWQKAIALIGLDSPSEDFDWNPESVQRLLVGGLIHQTKVQWKLEKFLAMPPAAAIDAESARVRSLALGICQQAMILRLPRHSESDLAGWLANAESAPRRCRSTLHRLLELQKERNQLAPYWDGYHSGVSIEAAPAPSSSVALPVCAGAVEGPYWIAPDPIPANAQAPSPGLILVFRRARPETVRFFEGAKALVFIEGGVLSHACSVAREMGIPCVTAAGKPLWEKLVAAKGHGTLRVESMPGQKQASQVILI